MEYIDIGIISYYFQCVKKKNNVLFFSYFECSHKENLLYFFFHDKRAESGF